MPGIRLDRKSLRNKASRRDCLRVLGYLWNNPWAPVLTVLRLRAAPLSQVHPKYRNAAKESETWAARGKKPRWLAAQLKSGKQTDDFRIGLAAAQGAERAFFFCARSAAISQPILLS